MFDVFVVSGVGVVMSMETLVFTSAPPPVVGFVVVVVVVIVVETGIVGFVVVVIVFVVGFVVAVGLVVVVVFGGVVIVGDVVEVGVWTEEEGESLFDFEIFFSMKVGKKSHMNSNESNNETSELNLLFINMISRFVFSLIDGDGDGDVFVVVVVVVSDGSILIFLGVFDNNLKKK